MMVCLVITKSSIQKKHKPLKDIGDLISPCILTNQVFCVLTDHTAFLTDLQKKVNK